MYTNWRYGNHKYSFYLLGMCAFESIDHEASGLCFRFERTFIQTTRNHRHVQNANTIYQMLYECETSELYFIKEIFLFPINNENKKRRKINIIIWMKNWKVKICILFNQKVVMTILILLIVIICILNNL